ncbi:MAG TPA: hypothetical protein VK846_00655 [Candidatus Limnocylindria bacterium]|nr:hypothetical protein [Candidatus Limnocylindria bacterium]
MKTWKTVLCVCRSSKSGRFSAKGKCKAYKKTKIRPKRNVLFALALCASLLFTGCSFSAVKRGEARAVNARLFWNTEGFELDVETNGTARVRIAKSNPDAESLKAVAAGAAEGAVKGAK